MRRAQIDAHVTAGRVAVALRQRPAHRLGSGARHRHGEHAARTAARATPRAARARPRRRCSSTSEMITQSNARVCERQLVDAAPERGPRTGVRHRAARIRGGSASSSRSMLRGVDDLLLAEVERDRGDAASRTRRADVPPAAAADVEHAAARLEAELVEVHRQHGSARCAHDLAVRRRPCARRALAPGEQGLDARAARRCPSSRRSSGWSSSWPIASARRRRRAGRDQQPAPPVATDDLGQRAGGASTPSAPRTPSLRPRESRSPRRATARPRPSTRRRRARCPRPRRGR